MNARLLEILEKQDQNKNDDEVKFYKRFKAHKPQIYDGEVDPIKFEDWNTYTSKLLDVVSCPRPWKSKWLHFIYNDFTAIWWNSIKRIPQQSESTWAGFVKNMKDYIIPPTLWSEDEVKWVFYSWSRLWCQCWNRQKKFLELSWFTPDLWVMKK